MLEVRALSAQIGRLDLIERVDLHVNAGETLALVGASGSGKSLTARAILGLPPRGIAFGGEITLDGRSILNAPERALSRLRGPSMAMVFQEPATALNPIQRIGRQIEEPFAIHTELSASARQEKVAELLEKTGLAAADVGPERYPHELSGGQRQRVAVAIALALAPKLVVADEPTSALDALSAARVLDLLATMTREAGAALILITHDLSVAARAARVVVMAKGNVAETGPRDQILTHPQSVAGRALRDGLSLDLPPRPKAHGAPVLKVQAMDVLRHGRPIVEGADIVVRRGERLAVVGGSGSGKTTLMRGVLGLLHARGAVALSGENVQPGAAVLRRKVQIVFQDPATSFNPRHSVGRIVAEPLFRSGLPRHAVEEKVREALQRVEMPSDSATRKPHAFSGGQRQRIAIARALVTEPEVLVADEAVSALDAATRSTIITLLDRLTRELGMAIVFIAHDLWLVRAFADRVAVMADGRIVETGETETIFAKPEHPATQALVRQADIHARGFDAALS
ncbi:MAG: ABC transporter ATP-binding protein [Devosia sp.]